MHDPAAHPASRRIGLIGGMSWESTMLYCDRLDAVVKRRLGGAHNARCALVTLDFAELVALAEADDWASIGRLVGGAGRAVEAAGADFIVITSMAGHSVADHLAAVVSIPLLHAGEVLAEESVGRGLSRLGLLGTGRTLTEDFLKQSLTRRGVETLIPGEARRAELDGIIFGELTRGQVTPGAAARVLSMIEELRREGAESVALVCTELPLLLPFWPAGTPVLDVVQLHVEAAGVRALAGPAAPPGGSAR